MLSCLQRNLLNIPLIYCFDLKIVNHKKNVSYMVCRSMDLTTILQFATSTPLQIICKFIVLHPDWRDLSVSL